MGIDAIAHRKEYSTQIGLSEALRNTNINGQSERWEKEEQCTTRKAGGKPVGECPREPEKKTSNGMEQPVVPDTAKASDKKKAENAHWIWQHGGLATFI